MVYLPKEIFSHILSYNDSSLKRHKEKQKYINDFFSELRENKENIDYIVQEIYDTILDTEEIQQELYDFILMEMIDETKSRDISIYLLSI